MPLPDLGQAPRSMILAVTLNPAIDFTVFGEDFHAHQTNRGQDIFPDPGGKGNNAARIAHLLGSEVTVTGFIGGFTGDFIESRLQRDGIHAAFYRIGDLTRITVAFVERDRRKETKIVPHGPKLTIQQGSAFYAHFQRLIQTARFSMIALCGSLPAGLPEQYYGELIEIAKAHSIPIILDTSGPALIQGAAYAPFMIKPNMEEARELSGKKTRAAVFAFLRGLASRIGIVALTLGSEGAIFFTADGMLKISSQGPHGVNAVGAGDAFIGGFLAAYDQFGHQKEVLCSWATAAGTCTARSPGLLWPRDQFERVLETLEIER